MVRMCCIIGYVNSCDRTNIFNFYHFIVTFNLRFGNLWASFYLSQMVYFDLNSCRVWVEIIWAGHFVLVWPLAQNYPIKLKEDDATCNSTNLGPIHCKKTILFKEETASNRGPCTCRKKRVGELGHKY